VARTATRDSWRGLAVSQGHGLQSAVFQRFDVMAGQSLGRRGGKAR